MAVHSSTNDLRCGSSYLRGRGRFPNHGLAGSASRSIRYSTVSGSYGLTGCLCA
jgi:hypothetical protein